MAFKSKIKTLILTMLRKINIEDHKGLPRAVKSEVHQHSFAEMGLDFCF